MNVIFRFCKTSGFRFVLKVQWYAFRMIYDFQKQSTKGVLKITSLKIFENLKKPALSIFILVKLGSVN